MYIKTESCYVLGDTWLITLITLIASAIEKPVPLLVYKITQSVNYAVAATCIKSCGYSLKLWLMF